MLRIIHEVVTLRKCARKDFSLTQEQRRKKQKPEKKNSQNFGAFNFHSQLIYY